MLKLTEADRQNALVKIDVLDLDYEEAEERYRIEPMEESDPAPPFVP